MVSLVMARHTGACWPSHSRSVSQFTFSAQHPAIFDGPSFDLTLTQDLTLLTLASGTWPFCCEKGDSVRLLGKVMPLFLLCPLVANAVNMTVNCSSSGS